MSISRKCPICPSSSSFFSARRRALGLSPQELARRAGLPVNAIERLENGQFLPAPSQAYPLGLALQVDPVEFSAGIVTLLLLHPEFLLEHIAGGTA